MKYYLIAEIEITDQSWVPEYIKNATGMVERRGGKYLSRTPRWRESKASESPLEFS